MGAYMYPIRVKKEPQIVRYHKEIELESEVLTFEILRKYVTETEKFSIYVGEGDSQFGSKIMLCIYGERLETEEEAKSRIGKEENYMKNYNEFQAIKKTKTK